MHARPAETPAELEDWLRHRVGRLLLLFAGVLLPLAVFAAMAGEIHRLEGALFDTPLLWQLRGWHSPGLDRVFVWLSRLGYQYAVIPLDVLLVLGLCLSRQWRAGLFACLGVAGSALLNLGAKQVFQRQRPSLWESIAPESTFSFPSGHAMGAMTLALVLVVLLRRHRWRWPAGVLAVVFALLVGVSRIYLGVHYPSDVVAGWCAALAWVLGLALLLYRRRSPPSPAA